VNSLAQLYHSVNLNSSGERRVIPALPCRTLPFPLEPCWVCWHNIRLLAPHAALIFRVQTIPRSRPLPLATPEASPHLFRERAKGNINADKYENCFKELNRGFSGVGSRGLGPLRYSGPIMWTTVSYQPIHLCMFQNWRSTHSCSDKINVKFYMFFSKYIRFERYIIYQTELKDQFGKNCHL